MKTPNTTMKTPNTKLQTPKKSQGSNPNPAGDVGALELGLWRFSGVCILVFGVFIPVFGAFHIGLRAPSMPERHEPTNTAHHAPRSASACRGFRRRVSPSRPPTR